jgi:type I restriction enzyme S subunit
MGRLEDKDVYVFSTRDSLAESAGSDLTLFPKGTVLFTKSGMSTLLNQRAILGRDMHVVSHVGTCVPLGGLPSEWAYYWLKTVDFKDLTHATTLPSLQLPKVKAIEIPLAPLPEQRRIVAKIEELFSQLDAGVEELRKAKAQLKRYRQSVLKAAFEGKLTEEWRRQRANRQEPIETAQELLARIKMERQQAAANSHRKYKEPPPLDTSELPELPKGWEYTRVGDIALLVTKGSTPTSYGFDYVGAGIRYVKVENIAGERVVADADMQFIARDAHSFLLRSQLASGDVLYTIAGTIGKVAVVHEEDLPANTNQAVAIIRVPLDYVRPDYLKYALMSPRARESIVRKPRGVGMNNVSLGDVRDLVCGLPSQDEQSAVVGEIERRLSVVDAEEKAIEAALKQAARLRQSILKRAFEGRLVPQDPSDEPAERLLERIRVEKAKRAAGQPRGRGRRIAAAGK